jgi:hypothetical protein
VVLHSGQGPDAGLYVTARAEQVDVDLGADVAGGDEGHDLTGGEALHLAVRVI